jgi:hypothetical protein
MTTKQTLHILGRGQTEIANLKAALAYAREGHAINVISRGRARPFDRTVLLEAIEDTTLTADALKLSIEADNAKARAEVDALRAARARRTTALSTLEREAPGVTLDDAAEQLEAMPARRRPAAPWQPRSPWRG